MISFKQNKPWCVLGVVYLCLMSLASGDTPQYIRLKEPPINQTLSEQPLEFVWEHRGLKDRDGKNTYDLVLWTPDGRFGKTLKVTPVRQDEKGLTYQVKRGKSLFSSPGLYYWQIKTRDVSGNEIISDTRSLVVTGRNFVAGGNPWNFVYSLRLRRHHRFRSKEFVGFLGQIESEMNFQDFGELGLVFRQDRTLVSTLDLRETFLLSTQKGMGVEAAARMLAFENLYFAMYPTVEVKSSWFSTGLKEYESSLWALKLGCEIDLMPDNYLILKAYWVPDYRISYLNPQRQTRTYDGDGISLGVRFLISHSIIRPFTIGGIEVDLEKIPLEYNYLNVMDSYTGVRLKSRAIGIGLLFN